MMMNSRGGGGKVIFFLVSCSMLLLLFAHLLCSVAGNPIEAKEEDPLQQRNASDGLKKKKAEKVVVEVTANTTSGERYLNSYH